MKRFVLIVLAILVLLHYPVATVQAQVLVWDPVNWATKWADYLKRLAEIIQRAQQIRNEIEMLVNWGRQLSSFDLDRLLQGVNRFVELSCTGECGRESVESHVPLSVFRFQGLLLSEYGILGIAKAFVGASGQ